MTVYITRMEGSNYGQAQVPRSPPIAFASGTSGTVTATEPTEIWQIYSDATHTLTWENGVAEVWVAGREAMRGVNKGSSITIS